MRERVDLGGLVKDSQSVHPAFIFCCIIAFATVLLPVFFNLATNTDALFNTQSFEAFRLTASCGLLAGGIIMTFVGFIFRSCNALTPLPLFIALASSVSGVMPLMLSAFIEVPVVVVSCFGFVFGAGLAILILAWSLLAKSSDITHLLMGCSICCVIAVISDNLLSLLPDMAAALVYVFVLVIGVLPLAVRAADGTLSFPHYDTPLSTLSIDSRDDALIRRSSFADLAFTASIAIIGLMVFTLNSGKVQFPPFIAGLSSVSLGIVVSGLIIAVATRLFRNRPILPFTFWILFPVIAGVSIVVDGFPVDSPVFLIGAGGVYFFLASISVFAVAFLLAINSKGEFSPLLVVGISVCLLSLSILLSYFLNQVDLIGEERGRLSLILSLCYFVFILISPAIQLWRVRRDSIADVEPLPGRGKDGLDDTCNALAERFGISRREKEVLYYVGLGYNSSYIARILFISDGTVRSHLKNIYRKLGVSSRMEVVELFVGKQEFGKNPDV
jgi:DNA-binding CsgD family transcriptional regulator